MEFTYREKDKTYYTAWKDYASGLAFEAWFMWDTQDVYLLELWAIHPDGNIIDFQDLDADRETVDMLFPFVRTTLAAEAIKAQLESTY